MVFTMNTMNTVLFIMIFEIVISRRFQVVSAGDRDPTMDYLNHTCGVAFRDVSDLHTVRRFSHGSKCDFRTRPSFAEFIITQI